MFDAYLRTQISRQFGVPVDKIERTYRGEVLTKVSIDLPDERTLMLAYKDYDSHWEVRLHDDEGNLVDNVDGDETGAVEGIADALDLAAKLVEKAVD